MQGEEAVTLEAGLVTLAMTFRTVAEESASLPERAITSPRLLTIWRAIQHVLSEGGEPSLVTVQARLAETGELPSVGGLSYLAGLAADCPYTLSQAQEIREELLRRHVIREVRRVGTMLLSAGMDEAHSAAEVLEEADRILSVARDTGHVDVERIGGPMEDRYLQYGTGAEERSPVTFGVEPVDKLFRGFRPGNLVVLGGRTSMGKSHVLLHVARRCGIWHKRPVLFVSLEMSRAEVLDRIFGAEAGVDTKLLEAPDVWLDKEQSARAVEALSRIKSSPMYVTERHRTIAEVRGAAGRVRSREGDLGLVVIDYLELLEDATDSESEVERLGELTRRLRSLAIHLDVPVLVAHQLSRAPDSRQNKAPQLSDLRQSGHIENAADAVLLLYRPGYYDWRRDQSELWVCVAKQRMGEVGTAVVRIDLPTGRITAYERGAEPPPERTVRQRAEEAVW